MANFVKKTAKNGIFWQKMLKKYHCAQLKSEHQYGFFLPKGIYITKMVCIYYVIFSEQFYIAHYLFGGKHNDEKI